jgi:hypothetical protein
LSVNAFFNDFNGFSTFSFPGAAVGGGNFGGGGFGGAAVGVNAGMNGVIGDEGYLSGVQVANANAQDARAAGQPGMMRAGPMPGDQGVAPGNPLIAGGVAGGFGGEFGAGPGFDEETALMIAMENGSRRSARSSSGNLARSPRRTARKTSKSAKSPRRQNTTAKSTSR